MEIWKDIAGYEGYYQISNLGKVKSLARKKWKGDGYYNCRERVLKPIVNKYGYCFVNLCKQGKRKGMRINRIVAKAFLPNPENKPEVNHKNGNKSDNLTANLEWCTRSENEKHARNNGLKARGEKHHNSKLTTEDVIKIKKLLKSRKYYQREIAKMFNVKRGTIKDIKINRNWKHVRI